MRGHISEEAPFEEEVTMLSESVEKPVLSEEAFHGLAGEMVRLIEPSSEADPVALLTSILTAFGNVIGRGSHVRVESSYHHLKLFTALVGETSKGRKGTSWGYPKRLMTMAEPEWGEFIVDGLASGEGLINAVRDPSVPTESPDDDDLEERDHNRDDRRLLVVASELSQPLKVMKRDGNTLSPALRNAWDGSSLQVITRNDPMRASRAHISIIGHITKSELIRQMSETEMANGFANRFLWLMVERSKCLPFGGSIDDEHLEPYASRLRTAIEFGKEAGEITWGETSKDPWSAVYPLLSEGKPGLVGFITGRAEAQVMRLAAIYAVMDRSRTIEADHLMAALAIWEYAEASVRYIFGDATGDSVANRILKAIKGSGAEGVTRRGIRDLFSRNKSSNSIDAALGLLADEGRIRRESERTGGRPAERWFSQ